VDPSISHGDGPAQCDLGVGVSEFLGHPVGCFADDAKAADHGGLMELDGVERGLVRALDEVKRVAASRLHMQQQGFILPPRSAALPVGCAGGARSAVAALLDGPALDPVGRSPEGLFQRVLQVEEGSEAGSAVGSTSTSRPA
jgi:hypothetical protein